MKTVEFEDKLKKYNLCVTIDRGGVSSVRGSDSNGLSILATVGEDLPMVYTVFGDMVSFMEVNANKVLEIIHEYAKTPIRLRRSNEGDIRENIHKIMLYIEGLAHESVELGEYRAYAEEIDKHIQEVLELTKDSESLEEESLSEDNPCWGGFSDDY